jgi:hypothetical protein
VGWQLKRDQIVEGCTGEKTENPIREKKILPVHSLPFIHTND